MAGALRAQIVATEMDVAERALCPPFLGLCILVMAVIITLPIPFGNVLPVIALAVLAVALIERDGVAVMWALFLSAAAIVWTGALVMFGAQGLDALGRLFV